MEALWERFVAPRLLYSVRLTFFTDIGVAGFCACMDIDKAGEAADADVIWVEVRAVAEVGKVIVAVIADEVVAVEDDNIDDGGDIALSETEAPLRGTRLDELSPLSGERSVPRPPVLFSNG